MSSPESPKQMLRGLAKFSLSVAVGVLLVFLIFGAVRAVEALASELWEAFKYRAPLVETIECRNK